MAGRLLAVTPSLIAGAWLRWRSPFLVLIVAVPAGELASGRYGMGRRRSSRVFFQFRTPGRRRPGLITGARHFHSHAFVPCLGAFPEVLTVSPLFPGFSAVLPGSGLAFALADCSGLPAGFGLFLPLRPVWLPTASWALSRPVFPFSGPSAVQALACSPQGTVLSRQSRQELAFSLPAGPLG